MRANNATRANLHPTIDIWSGKGRCAQFIRAVEFSHRLCTQNSESNISINRRRLGVTLRVKKVYIFVQQYVWFEADRIIDVFHINFLIN